MALTSLIAEKGYLLDSVSCPQFCSKHSLKHRFAVNLTSSHSPLEAYFLVVKRFLKLFPFEKLKVEVELGRVRDVFEDWDSYLEWLRAESTSDALERCFKKIEVWRFKKCLGYLCWENVSSEGRRSLAIYTEGDQSAPFLEVCQKVAAEFGINQVQMQEGHLNPSRSGVSLQFFKLFR